MGRSIEHEGHTIVKGKVGYLRFGYSSIGFITLCLSTTLAT